MKIQSDTMLSSLSNAATSRYQKNKIEDFKNSLDNAGKSKDKKEIRKVAEEFEAFFIKSIFKSMRQTSKLSNSIIEKSFDREMYEQMMDEKMAEDISQGRGIGLADELYKQMISRYGYTDKHNDNDEADSSYKSMDVLK